MHQHRQVIPAQKKTEEKMTDQILNYIVMIPPLLLALTLHEFAHGWVAWRLGDPTAKNMGRLTLNPISHLDPVGTIAFIILRFGWAKPVPVNPSYFKNPLKDMLWVAAAGPATNMLLAVVSALLYKTLIQVISGMQATELLLAIIPPVLGMLYASVWINLVLCVFNLLPVPPLDGSRILTGILPPAMARSYLRVERYGFIVLLVLMLTGVIGGIISPFINSMSTMLLN